jgi:hypothetical protein
MISVVPRSVQSTTLYLIDLYIVYKNIPLARWKAPEITRFKLLCIQAYF